MCIDGDLEHFWLIYSTFWDQSSEDVSAFSLNLLVIKTLRMDEGEPWHNGKVASS